MSKAKKPIPDGYHTLTPHMVLKDAAKAIEFYKKAFGAVEMGRMPGPDGKIMHAEIKIGNSPVMLCDEFPEMGAMSAETIGKVSTYFFLYVGDVDAAFKKAVDAGCVGELEPTDMFWGDRYSKLVDPFGYKWSIGSRIEDLSPEEIAERGKEFMKQTSGCGAQ